MSSLSAQPAIFILQGPVSLENKRVLKQKPFSFLYDTQFSVSHPASAPTEGCSIFQCFIGQTSDDTHDEGLFWLSVLVCSFVLLCWMM